MNEPPTATATDAPAASVGEPVNGVRGRLSLSATPDAPPHTHEAVAAFGAEFPALLARRAAHPNEQWIVYRGGCRAGFGTDHREFLRECRARFPDGLFEIFFIDPSLQCPDDTVV